MAFTEPIHHDLAGVLAGGFYDRPVHSETNLLRRSTVGIRLLYSEISASKSFGGMVVRDPSTTTDRDGRLITGNSNPTLAKRYRLLEAIGTGSFSQIFKALDMYAEKHVAVKVLHAGLASLGDRESRALRYFRSKEVRGAKHFVEILDTFWYGKHFCIVEELYDTTLLGTLVMPSMPGSDALLKFKPHESNFLSVERPLCQPRVVRPGFIDNTGSSSSAARQLTGSISAQESTVQNLDVRKLRKIATSLLSALCIMRKEGAIHADIKPENCFVKFLGRYRNAELDNQLASSGGYRPSPSTTSPTTSLHGFGSGGAAGASGLSVLGRPASGTAKGGADVHLANLPADFEVHLGDFGNAIHVSEISKYYTNFDMQTLPYRAPEVLLGVPFSHQIDMWSLGILLVEICIGKPLFLVRNREELYDAICSRLSPPPRIRFAGGMYSELLEREKDAVSSCNKSTGFRGGNSIESFDDKSRIGLFESTELQGELNAQNVKINFSTHLLAVKKLLQQSVSEVPGDVIHFLAGLLHPDPDFRLTPIDAMQHPFILSGIPISLALINLPLAKSGGSSNRSAAAAACLRLLRAKSLHYEETTYIRDYRPRGTRYEVDRNRDFVHAFGQSEGTFSQNEGKEDQWLLPQADEAAGANGADEMGHHEGQYEEEEGDDEEQDIVEAHEQDDYNTNNNDEHDYSDNGDEINDDSDKDPAYEVTESEASDTRDDNDEEEEEDEEDVRINASRRKRQSRSITSPKAEEIASHLANHRGNSTSGVSKYRGDSDASDGDRDDEGAPRRRGRPAKSKSTAPVSGQAQGRVRAPGSASTSAAASRTAGASATKAAKKAGSTLTFVRIPSAATAFESEYTPSKGSGSGAKTAASSSASASASGSRGNSLMNLGSNPGLGAMAGSAMSTGGPGSGMSNAAGGRARKHASMYPMQQLVSSAPKPDRSPPRNVYSNSSVSDGAQQRGRELKLKTLSDERFFEAERCRSSDENSAKRRKPDSLWN